MKALEYLYPRPLKYLSSHLYVLVKGRLWVKVLLGLMAGIGTGILLGDPGNLVAPKTASVIGNWLALPGRIFLTLIQMIVVPLVFASVIRGLAASENLDQLKKLGSRVVLYFLFTTTVAITIGIVTATVINPGAYVDTSAVDVASRAGGEGEVETLAEAGGTTSLSESIVDLLPENPLVSMVEKEMLQVVLFAVILGLALIVMNPDQSRLVLDLLGALQEICMTVVRWAMVLAPFAVFGLMARITIRIGLDALLGMTAYVGSVLLGLVILLVFYLLLVALVGKKNPLVFLNQVREVQLLAFSTSSSAAVMPLSMKTAEEKLAVRPSIAQFLIPFGATINMDGTALYQGVATVFLAQVYGVELEISALLVIVVTAVGASIGTPATPGVGIVILATVLRGAGIPAGGVALIIGVDRILDMSRTMLNVTGDLTACAVMDRLVGGRRTAIEAAAEEEQREKQRLETSEDVVIGKA